MTKPGQLRRDIAIILSDIEDLEAMHGEAREAGLSDQAVRLAAKLAMCEAQLAKLEIELAEYLEEEAKDA